VFSGELETAFSENRRFRKFAVLSVKTETVFAEILRPEDAPRTVKPIDHRKVSHVTTAKNASKVAAEMNTPTDLSADAVEKVSKALNGLLADAFALYLKTKNFHWHLSGRHFRDYHLMLDEQSDQIFATTDPLAERVRKIGGRTLRSIGEVAKLQTIKDNDETYVPPIDMLLELMNDNKKMATAMRKAHEVCDDAKDVASASLLENYIDDTERRTWFLFEASRQEGGNEA
jgi:starvation-inducible DNA-binding protein